MPRPLGYDPAPIREVMGGSSGYSPLLSAMILAPLVTIWHVPTFLLEEGGLQPPFLGGGLVVTMAVTF